MPGSSEGESAPIHALNVSRNDKEAASYKKLGWEEFTGYQQLWDQN